MLRDIPVQAWLLIAAAFAAYVPARYVYRYAAHSPSRRDMTQPSEDLSWRTSGDLARNLAILGALAAFAIFIFTPAAAAFARSPSFFPILITAMGVWSIGTVVRALSTGRIEPMSRGFNNSYERETQPKRFWASMLWNALIGVGCVTGGFLAIRDAPIQALKDRCYDAKDAFPPKEKLSACNQLIGEGSANADAYLNRGVIFLDLGKFDQAVADFTRAHELNPKDAMALADRRVSYAWKRDNDRAEQDLSAAQALDPSNRIVLHGEAILSMNSNDFVGAIDRLSTALARDPRDAWSLSARAEVYRRLGDDEKMRVDTSALERLKATSGQASR